MNRQRPNQSSNRIRLLTTLATLASLAALAPLSQVEAAQFGFIGAGARAQGMGGAFIGVADDATAIFWNPSGLTHILEPEISVVGRLDNSSCNYPSFLSAYKPDSMSGASINFASAAYNFVAFGKRHVAVAASYATLYDFERNSRSQTGTGGVDTLHATVGGKLSQIALGAAIDVTPGFFFGTAFYYHVGREAESDVTRNTAGTVLSQTDYVTTYTGNPAIGLGVLWEISTKLRAGAMGIFSFSPLDNSTVSGSVTTKYTFKLPSTWGVGASFAPTDWVLIASDWRSIQWGGVELNGSKPVYSNGVAVFSDAGQWHVGVEFLISKSPWNEYPLPIRFGFYTDPLGPQTSSGYSANANVLTMGTSFLMEKAEISMTYAFATRDYGTVALTNSRLEEPTSQLILSIIYHL